MITEAGNDRGFLYRLNAETGEVKHYEMRPEIFRKIYGYTYPIIKQLEHERIEDVNFTDEGLKRKIRDIFYRVADCPGTGRYESTDASKILHTILPSLFVMWDDKIREGEVKGGHYGAVYANVFLPKVQEELAEAIKTCMDEQNLSRKEAIEYIHKQCDNKTLAKLADEHNYMKYTKRCSSLWAPTKGMKNT